MPRQHHNHNFGVVENRFEPSPPKMLSPQQQNHLYLPEDEYEMQPIRKNKRREKGNWIKLLYGWIYELQYTHNIAQESRISLFCQPFSYRIIHIRCYQFQH